MITLTRFAYSPIGTFGILTIRDWSCYTVERPWIRNVQRVSCIPEGIYPLRKRRSLTVERITDGKFPDGWELEGVPYRSHILIHPANTMDDLQGCIGVGQNLGFIAGRWAVTDSQATFAQLMAELDALPDTERQIRVQLTENRP